VYNFLAFCKKKTRDVYAPLPVNTNQKQKKECNPSTYQVM